MTSLKRVGIFCAVLANGSWAMTGCLSQNGKNGAGKDGSVLASIGGINDKDKDRAFTYELVCGDLRVVGEAKADKDFVRFPGDKLKDGLECAMEVRVAKDEAAKIQDDFEWNGRSGGVKDVGLFYGSDVQKIAGSKLALTLYSLASPIVDNAFSVQANIKFELAAGETLPVEADAASTIVCGEDKKSYGGSFKKDANANEATLVIANLPVKELKGKTCSEIQVMEKNAARFSAQVTDIKFDDVKKGDLKVFPDKDDQTKRYVVKAIPVGGGDVDTTTTGGGACLDYDNTAHVCKDLRKSSDLAADFPGADNWMLARVKGKAFDQGETKTFLVGAAKDGSLAALPNKAFNVTDLNNSLAADSNKTFVFFKDAADEAFTGAKFDAAFLSSGLTKATADELKGMKILHIEKIFLHGMHAVPGDLAGRAAPLTWMMVVKVKKEAIVSEFVVTGKDQGFTSETAPLTVADKPAYFDFKTLATEMAAAPGTAKWKVYALKGGAMSAANCGLERFNYEGGLSVTIADTIKNFGVQDGVLANCEITQAKWDQALSAVTPTEETSEAFVWEWYVPTK